MKSIIMALGLQETADEAAIVAQINKLKMSARVGDEIEKMVGALGDSAIGTVRALKETATVQASQAEEIAKVKATLARNQFDAIRDQGFSDKKLTPALAKMYSDRFDAELAEGRDGSATVSEIKAYLSAAPRIAAISGGAFGRQFAQQPEGGPLQYNGKTFAAMKHMERAQLSKQDPELYAAMRQDWEAAGKPAA